MSLRDSRVTTKQSPDPSQTKASTVSSVLLHVFNSLHPQVLGSTQFWLVEPQKNRPVQDLLFVSSFVVRIITEDCHADADVDVRDPDEKSIMTYVAQFLQYSRDLPVQEEMQV